MTIRHIFGNIAEIYLDLYSIEYGIERPLSPEQVKDAGVLFLDLLAAQEAARLIADARRGGAL